MPISNDQYNRILARLTKLEETINDLVVAQNNLVSNTEVQQLLIIQQTEQVALREIIEALDERVTTLEEEPIS